MNGFWDGITVSDEDDKLCICLDGDTVVLFEQGWPPLFGVVVDGKVEDHEFVNWQAAREYAVALLRNRRANR